MKLDKLKSGDTIFGLFGRNKRFMEWRAYKIIEVNTEARFITIEGNGRFFRVGENGLYRLRLNKPNTKEI